MSCLQCFLAPPRSHNDGALTRSIRGVEVYLFVVVVLVQFFVAEVEAEVRFTASARDLKWDFGAGAILAKERIDRLQENRFPAAKRRHLLAPDVSAGSCQR